MQSPCKDCLTLAICRGQLQGGDLFDLVGLGDKCVYMKWFIFPNKKPIFTATQELEIENVAITGNPYKQVPVVVQSNIKIDDPNKHLDQCIEALKEDLLKGITFSGNFNFDRPDPQVDPDEAIANKVIYEASM